MVPGDSGDAARCWRAPNDIFPVETIAIGGRQTIAKGAIGAQGGAWPSVPSAYTPLHRWMIFDSFGRSQFSSPTDSDVLIFIVFLDIYITPGTYPGFRPGEGHLLSKGPPGHPGAP